MKESKKKCAYNGSGERDYELLYDNKWLQLKIADDQYVFMHEKRCKGEIVAVLPYRIVGDSIEVFIRYENNTAWTNKRDEFLATCITGGVEDGDALETAKVEMKEEGVYVIDEDSRYEVIGEFRNSKASDTRIHLFVVQVYDNDEQIEAKGDGSVGEQECYCKWQSLTWETMCRTNDLALSHLLLCLINDFDVILK